MFWGDFGDIWIGISEDIQKIDLSSQRTRFDNISRLVHKLGITFEVL
jgi:hypothetical protein